MIFLENRPKGTYDLFNEEIKEFTKLEEHLKKVLNKYGFTEIRTPIFEHSSVFHRDSELSDMVTKETYNFQDKGNRLLTLRPEGTAGVIRAYVENKMYLKPLTKLYYIGPFFRYERPQKGRFRQFYQMGMEAIGEQSALLDAEIVSVSYEVIKSLGLKNVTINLNTLGKSSSQPQYKEILTNYFTPHIEELCGDCKRRITENPLRILDCKVDQQKEFVIEAPTPIDYLDQDDLAFYNEVKNNLRMMNVPFVENKRLVRGLDYYGQTVFEIVADIKGFGSQNVLGGGGHYENLVKELGGPDKSGIGVAFGLERLLEALRLEGIKLSEDDYLDAYIITFGEAEQTKALEVLTTLRNEDFKVSIDYYKRSFKAQLREALSLNAKYLIIIGDQELESNILTVKETKTEVQKEMTIDEFIRKAKENDYT